MGWGETHLGVPWVEHPAFPGMNTASGTGTSKLSHCTTWASERWTYKGDRSLGREVRYWGIGNFRAVTKTLEKWRFIRIHKDSLLKNVSCHPGGDWNPGARGCRSKSMTWFDRVIDRMIDGWYGLGWLESTVNLTWLYRVGCCKWINSPCENFVSTNTSICSLEKPTRISSTFWEGFGTPEVFFYHALLRWIFRVLGNGGTSFILSPPKWWQRCPGINCW